MPDFADRNRSSDPNASSQNMSGIDMVQLQSMLRQQAQQRRIYENIAVLGCGYLGGALAEFWQTQGHFVTGTTTTQNRVGVLSEILSRVVVMRGDDRDAMASLLEGQDTVLVSVAPTGSRLADEETYAKTYLDSARNLAEVLPQVPTIKQVIYISSCSVYGDRQGDWVDETASIAPPDFRSQVVYEAEQIVSRVAQDDRKVCILRLGGIYGPGRELVGKFGGMAGETLPGNGDRIINWVHLDDIMGAVEFARLNQLSGIYNVVDDSQLTVKEQLDRICRRYGLPLTKWNPTQPSPFNKSLRVSNQKLKAAGYPFFHPQLAL